MNQIDESDESAEVDRPRQPGDVAPYAYGIAVAGLTAAIVVAVSDPTFHLVQLPLALTALVSTHAPVRLQLGAASTHAVTLGESTIVALLIAAPSGLVPVWLVGAVLLASVVRRVPPVKGAYNLGSEGLSSALALTVVVAVLGDRGGEGLGPALVVGVLGALTYQLVQLGLIAELVRRLEGVPLRETVRGATLSSMVTVGFTTMFGALLGIAARLDPAVAWLGPPLMLGLWFALRDLNAAAAATHTSLHLHEVTNLIADTDASLDAVVTSIAETFGAGAVLIHLPGAEHPSEHMHDTSGRGLDDVRAAAAQVDLGPAPTRVDTARHAVACVATVEAPTGTGYLAVAATRAPWTDREVALLGTLATHLGTNLRTLALLEQVTEESRKLTDIIEAAGDGIALISADGVVVTWNPGMERLTGTGSDAIGRPIAQMLTWRDPDDGSRDSALPPALEATLRGEETGPVDLEVLRGDRWRHARCRFSPVGAPETGVTGAVLVARDRTVEADLDQVKHDFIAIVSHEIRTPLTPLKGMVELFGSRGDDVTGEVRTQMVEAMGRQLDRLDTLVSDLLTVADLDGGTLSLQPVPVALAEVCREAVAHHVPDDRQGGVALDLDDHVTVRADRSALARIVEALVTNAVKHGGDSIEVVVAGQDGDGIIEIRDDGPGIPEWEHAAVFERFRRVGTNLEWATQGPGLGLAIAAELAERMGMRIELDSAAGQGACFRLVGEVVATREASSSAETS